MIQNCRDFRRIKKICDYPISISHEVFYLMEVVDGRDLGFWLFYPYRGGLSVHACLGLECRGRKAAESGRNAFDWIFNHNSVNIIYAVIPAEKKHVCTLAIVVGFEFVRIEDDCRVYELKRACGMKKVS